MSNDLKHKIIKYNVKYNRLNVLLGGGDQVDTSFKKQRIVEVDPDASVMTGPIYPPYLAPKVPFVLPSFTHLPAGPLPTPPSDGPAGAGSGASAAYEDATGAASGVVTSSDSWIKFSRQSKPGSLPTKTRLGGVDFTTICSKNNAFSQHTGECWHDSVMQFMCFSDATRNAVLNTLLYNTVNDIIDTIPFYRTKYLPFAFNRFDILFKQNLKIYLLHMQKRVCNFIQSVWNPDLTHTKCKRVEPSEYKHIDDDLGEYTSDDVYLGEYTSREYLIGLDVSKMPMQRQVSAETGIVCSATALLFNKINPKFDPDVKQRGGNSYDFTSTMYILSYALLQNEEMIICLNDYDIPDIYNFIDQFVGVSFFSIDHAICAYDCNHAGVLYNDNIEKVIDFNWKFFLKSYYVTYGNKSDYECKIFYVNEGPPEIVNKLIMRVTHLLDNNKMEYYAIRGNENVLVPILGAPADDQIQEYHINKLILFANNVETHHMREIALKSFIINKFFIDLHNEIFEHVHNYLDIVDAGTLFVHIPSLGLDINKDNYFEYKSVINHLIHALFKYMEREPQKNVNEEFKKYIKKYMLNYSKRYVLKDADKYKPLTDMLNSLKPPKY